jgi:Winged helix-turn-helix DNA-binding
VNASAPGLGAVLEEPRHDDRLDGIDQRGVEAHRAGHEQESARRACLDGVDVVGRGRVDARRAGLSPAATSRRVQRLRADGVIEGVRAIVAPEQVGQIVEAFVVVSSPAELQRLLLALKRAGVRRATTMLRLQAIKPPAPVPVRAMSTARR